MDIEDKTRNLEILDQDLNDLLEEFKNFKEDVPELLEKLENKMLSEWNVAGVVFQVIAAFRGFIVLLLAITKFLSG